MPEQILSATAQSSSEYYGEDRRAAERLQSAGEVLWSPATGEGQFWPARLHDVSSLGLGLVLPRAVDVGTLLVLDLRPRCPTQTQPLSARVVHVTPSGEGEWLVGCALVGELSDQELSVFRAARVRPAGPDCRRWVRFPCSVETVCSGLDLVPVDQAPARIVDISPGGLGLLTVCEFEPGIILNVELPGETDAPRRRMVRVVHVRDRGNGDWFLGCEFAALLAPETLHALQEPRA